MSTVMADYTQLQQAVDTLAAIQSALLAAQTRTETVKNAVGKSFAGFTAGTFTGRSIEELETLSANVGALKSAVETAIALYRQTDGRLSITDADGLADLSGAGAEVLAAESSRAWYSRFNSWLASLLHPQPGVSAADSALSGSISALFSGDTYSRGNWEAASYDKRIAICKSLIGDLNKILGVNVSTKIVEFSDDASDGLIEHGALAYSPLSKMYMRVNKLDISNADYAEVMNTMVHEMRHAYQHAVVDSPDKFDVAQSTVDSWAADFDDYKTPDSDGFKAYYSQPVEADARSFAAGIKY